MHLFLIIALSLANFVVGLLVYIKNRKNPTNISFFVLVLAVVGWIIILYISDLKNSANLLLINRLTFFPTAFIAPTLYFFSLNFPTRNSSKKNIRAFIISAAFGTAFAFLSLTNLLVTDIRIGQTRVDVITGPAYYPFLISFVGFVIFSFINLLRSYRNSFGIKKLQARYLMLGFGITAFIASLTNLILPALTKSNPLAQYGSFATIVFPRVSSNTIFVSFKLSKITACSGLSVQHRSLSFSPA